MVKVFLNGSRFRHEVTPDYSRHYLILIGVAATLYICATQFVSIPVCPGRLFFGTQCPTCGVTNALQHLLHGRIRVALETNPLSALLIFTFARAVFAQYVPQTSRLLYFKHSDYLFLSSYFAIGFAFHLARTIER